MVLLLIGWIIKAECPTTAYCLVVDVSQAFFRVRVKERF
jgi:hypothetical protein